MEFADFMFFPYKRFHYAGCIHVFLHGIVQLIILIKYFDKIRMCLLCNKNQCSTEKRNYDQEKKCDLYINQQCHDPGKCNHDRSSCKKTDTHHVSHLHIRDISCHSCDQTRCRKMVNIFEGKVLHLIKNIMTEVLCISCTCHRRHISRLHTEIKCKHCHNYKDHSPLHNISQISVCNSHVNDLCHFQRNEHFHQYLQDYQQWRQ